MCIYRISVTLIPVIAQTLLDHTEVGSLHTDLLQQCVLQGSAGQAGMQHVTAVLGWCHGAAGA